MKYDTRMFVVHCEFGGIKELTNMLLCLAYE